MSGMTARLVESKDQVRLHTIDTFVEMLTMLQQFMSDPSLLKKLGQQTASAIAITDEEQKNRDALVADEERALKAIASMKDMKISLDDQVREIETDKKDALAEVESYRKKIDDDFAKRQVYLDGLESSLKEESAKLEEDRHELEAMISSHLSKQSEQDVREKQLLAMQEKIDSVKGALGLKG